MKSCWIEILNIEATIPDKRCCHVTSIVTFCSLSVIVSHFLAIQCGSHEGICVNDSMFYRYCAIPCYVSLS